MIELFNRGLEKCVTNFRKKANELDDKRDDFLKVYPCNQRRRKIDSMIEMII